MATRVNAYSMSQPDAYGNMGNSMVPKGTPSGGSLLTPPASPTFNPNKVVEDARKSVAGLKTIDKQVDKPIDWGEFAVNSMGKVGGAAGEMLPKGGTAKSADQGFSSDSTRATRDAGTAVLGGAPRKAGMSDLAKQSNPISAPKAGGGMAGKMGGAAGVAGAASVLTDIGGEALNKSKHEVWGGMAKGAGKGALIGANPLLVAATGGLSVAAGAVVGATVGGIKGNMDKNKRLSAESKAETARLTHNNRVKDLQRKTVGQSQDLAAYQSILNSSDGKTVRYKTGGLMKFGELDVVEAQAYLDTLKVAKHKEDGKLYNTPIIKHQLGGPVSAGTDDNTKKLMLKAYEMHQNGSSPQQIAETLKLDEPTMKKVMQTVIKLSANNKGTKPDTSKNLDTTVNATQQFRRGGPIFDFNNSKIPSLRRGGPLDVKKQNVIVDGPSHDEHNKTGVNGDRGLPVVRNGKKVAEIESDELVINATSSDDILDLRNKVAAGDKKAKEELGDLLMKELGENTYDYNKKL